MQGIHMTVYQPGDIIFISDGEDGCYAMRVDAHGVLVPISLGEAFVRVGEQQRQTNRPLPF